MGNMQELGRDIEDLTKTPATDSLFFSELERKVLELWDQEQEVALEIALLRAQRDANHDDISSLTSEEISAQLQQAERDLLTARSQYTIRQNIVNQVLITDPVLKSIHSPSTTSTLESRLLPLMNERDTLAMLHSHVSSQLQNTHLSIAKLEAQNVEAIASNKALAARMLALAREVGAEKVEDIGDARVRSELEKLEEEVRRARQDWRVWKSVVGGIVAGSGVDWAGDGELLEVVMDEEDETV